MDLICILCKTKNVRLVTAHEEICVCLPHNDSKGLTGTHTYILQQVFRSKFIYKVINNRNAKIKYNMIKVYILGVFL